MANKKGMDVKYLTSTKDTTSKGRVRKSGVEAKNTFIKKVNGK